MTFGPTLITVKNQLISADFNQLISDLAHNSTIFGQKHNVGCFSHSTFVIQPNSAFGTEKFQEFWNFLESLESLYESLKSGHFGQMGHHFHSILGPGFDSEVRIEIHIPKILEFLNFLGISGIRNWAMLESLEFFNSDFRIKSRA